MRKKIGLLVMVSALFGGCSGDAVFTDSGPPADSGGTEAYDVMFTSSPEHAHPGDVLTLNFAVTKDGTPLDGLEATCHFEQTVGGSAAGEVALMPGGAAGVYSGRRAFMSAGTYQLHFRFDDAGTMVERILPLVLAGH